MRQHFLLIIAIVTVFSINAKSQSSVPAFDAAMVTIQSPGYASPGDSFIIKGIFKNNGTAVLTDIILNWQVDDGEIHSYKKGGMNLSKSIRENFEHPDQLIVDKQQDFTLKVWVSEPNGEEDLKHSNDTLSKVIQVVTEFPERNILIEEATGAWCGWCPRGPITYRDAIKPNYPNTILVALHNGDDMAIADGNTVIQSYITGFPSGMIDRRNPGDFPFGMSTGDWRTAIEMMDRDFTPVELNVYNYFYPDTYEWQIDVVVDFIIDYQGDLRLNCFILEDSVTGTGSGYDQINYYNTRTDIPELTGIGSPIAGYYHNDVVREMLGGPWGQSGIIPNKAKKGERYIFSRTIKAKTDRWRMENIHLVGIIQAFNSNASYRPILNAKKKEVTMATGYDSMDIMSSIRIYPNPVGDQAILEFNNKENGKARIEIINLTGQTIREFSINTIEGKQSFALDCNSWAAGSYFVKMTQGDACQIVKLLKNN